MSTAPLAPFENPLRQELQPLRDHWLMLLLLGGGLVIIGVLAIVFSFIATLATVGVLGMLLFIGGVLEVVNAVTCRSWRGFVIHLLSGILYVVVGLVMMNHPVQAAVAITFVLAAAYMAGGIVRIVMAATERFQSWGWVMLNGFISLFLGLFIWRQFPFDSFWVIGLFVGIDMIFCGWSWIFLGIGIRSAFPNKT
jgi:uncharacterized membrane protein HdeD (DUF308 family)